MNLQHFLPILIADEDVDDNLMLVDAFTERSLKNPLFFVSDSNDLLAYLNKTGPFTKNMECPRPGLILVDINMPGMDAREAISEIKNNVNLANIPLILLTSSKSEQLILESQKLDIQGIIQKPTTFEEFKNVVDSLQKLYLS